MEISNSLLETIRSSTLLTSCPGYKSSLYGVLLMLLTLRDELLVVEETMSPSGAEEIHRGKNLQIAIAAFTNHIEAWKRSGIMAEWQKGSPSPSPLVLIPLIAGALRDRQVLQSVGIVYQD